jgi:hypothetical protein
MKHCTRNFSAGERLTDRIGVTAIALSRNPFFDLRSLPVPQGLAATLRRFSSSSLPPSFASGRFAGFSSSGRRAVGV